MKRLLILGLGACLAALAVVLAGSPGLTAVSVVDANNGYTVSGFVWDDTDDINGQPDPGEGAPSADVDLVLCLWDDGWDCEESAMEPDGTYAFTGLDAGDYELCIEVTPLTEWTLTMVLINGSSAEPAGRCYNIEVGTGDKTVNWGLANVSSEFSFTKVCDTDSIRAEEINCTLTVENSGETVLFSRNVWDYYTCGALEFVSADPAPGDSWEEDDECGVGWEDLGDADELYPGESEQYEITFVPAEGVSRATNCVGGAAWNVRILLDGDDYNAWWEDVEVDKGDCVDFDGKRHKPEPTLTSTPEPTATATPEPPPTVTTAPPPPTATPFGGPGGIVIAPPPTGTGATGDGGAALAWWLAAFGGLAFALGGGVALALRKTR